MSGCLRTSECEHEAQASVSDFGQILEPIHLMAMRAGLETTFGKFRRFSPCVAIRAVGE